MLKKMKYVKYDITRNNLSIIFETGTATITTTKRIAHIINNIRNIPIKSILMKIAHIKDISKGYDIFIFNFSKIYNIYQYIIKLHLVIWNILINNTRKRNIPASYVKKIFEKATNISINDAQKYYYIMIANYLNINYSKKYNVIRGKCHTILYSLIKNYNMILKSCFKIVYFLFNQYSDFFYIFVKLNSLNLDRSLLCF